MRVRKLEVFENACVGICAQTAHKLILVNESDEHFLTQVPLKDSSVIVWPVKRNISKAIKNGVNYFFEPDLQRNDITLLAVWNLKKFKAIKIVWRSWAWQRTTLDIEVTNKMVPAIRAFQDGPRHEFFQFMCVICFGKLSRTVVEMICKVAGEKFNSNQSFFQLLFEIIKRGLKLNDSGTLDILAQRFVATETVDDYSEHVLNIEEAVEVLEDQDIKVLNAERKQLPQDRETRASFKTEYVEPRSKVNAAIPAEAAVPKAAPKGRKVAVAAGGAGGAGGAKDDIPDSITQKSAKRFLPPGGQIWCGHKRHEWCGHLPPFSRISYMWRMLKPID